MDDQPAVWREPGAGRRQILSRRLTVSGETPRVGAGKRAHEDTIAAPATPPGRGAIGVLRVSGPGAKPIALAVTGGPLIARRVCYRTFRDPSGQPLDRGLVFLLEGPHSFTGEDMLELQSHGSPIVMRALLDRVCSLGARLARPGEFSERAFLNGKIDLVQAEAIADLIGSLSARAAQGALQSLQGELSQRVRQIVEALVSLRVWVEGSLDFSEEDVAAVRHDALHERLSGIATALDGLLTGARRGQILRDGLRIAIAGPPNAGKSSLLNRLARRECAIVTAFPGTTRDAIEVPIDIEGIAFELVDTAGVRETAEPIELAGIRRTGQVVQGADHVLWVIDAAEAVEPQEIAIALRPDCPITEVHNKIDLLGTGPRLIHGDGSTEIHLSAKTGAGLELLEHHLQELAGTSETDEGAFSARGRHVAALEHAKDALDEACEASRSARGEEIVAEHLKRAQHRLSELTGEFTSEDLLAEIFSSFCIGK